MKSTLIVMAALVLLATPSAANPVTIPDTPAGARVSGFLQVMNNLTEAGARSFIEANYSEMALKNRSMEERLQAFRELSENLAGGTVKSYKSPGPGQATVVVETASGWMKLQFRLEPETQKIAGIMFSPAPPVNLDIPPGKLSDVQIAAYLDTLLTSLAAVDQFSGTVLLAKDGKPFLERAYGQANKSYQVPNDIDTKFNLGSMNKMFTALATAQLAEAGKLSFDDPVGKHLPDYPNAAVRDKVTIHHLLTHTSGLGSYFESETYENTWPRLRKVADYLPIVAADTPQFEPGERMRYSNSGFVILGLIIEKLSGEDYYDYVKKHIFEPAGMMNTDSYEVDQIVPNLAIGYTSVQHGPGGPVETPLRANTMAHSAKGTPAGGGFSTVRDLLKFDQALRSNKLLGATHTEILLAGKIMMGPDMQYAYGFGDSRRNGHRSVGHNGGAPGINADFKSYLDLGYTSVVLANYDRAASTVADQIEELVNR